MKRMKLFNRKCRCSRTKFGTPRIELFSVDIPALTPIYLYKVNKWCIIELNIK
jgi:hypothetical protein